MATKNAPGTTRADMARPSLASLPYELQLAIFEAATGPQVFFMEIVNNVLTFFGPPYRGLSSACQLSRQVYTKGKRLCAFGSKRYWVNSELDIFFLSRDDPVGFVRPSVSSVKQLEGDKFKQSVILNVAVDLQYLGEHPRYEAAIRIWLLFTSFETLHVFIPMGPPHTPALKATPETLVLSAVPATQIVAAPSQDRELWLAVKYQLKRVYTKILASENGWNGRPKPDIVGHLTSLRVAPGTAGDGGSAMSPLAFGSQSETEVDEGHQPPA
ncbi:hypothetical protein VTK56DRAFT_9163 [Thermocarpiscus australiensis]